jgi:hypothetical protein
MQIIRYTHPIVVSFALAALIVAAPHREAEAQAVASLPPAPVDVDPAKPFGNIDTNLWYQAQYLSGYQADAERWRWVGSLGDAEKAEIRARCDVISADKSRFTDDAIQICVSVDQVLNRQ